jgi:hypothetical protein
MSLFEIPTADLCDQAAQFGSAIAGPAIHSTHPELNGMPSASAFYGGR